MASLADWTPLITAGLGAISVGGALRLTFRSRLTTKIKNDAELLRDFTSSDNLKIDLETQAKLRTHVAGLTRQLISESTDEARLESLLRFFFLYLFLGAVYAVLSSAFPRFGGPVLGNYWTPIVGNALLFFGAIGLGFVIGARNRRLSRAMGEVPSESTIVKPVANSNGQTPALRATGGTSPPPLTDRRTPKNPDPAAPAAERIAAPQRDT